jgi:DNA-directed RNA polymerase specialized sigma24 family protein
MNDPQLAAALRTRSPGALTKLFDAYGDQLFRYCWCMLRNRENAQIALRDTLVVAEERIGCLASPELLGPWLYSLARAECRRREPVPAADADEPPARPHQHDADSRLMAWQAAMSLEADEFEALELACRHDMNVRLVLDLPAAEAEELVDRAARNLERAVSAEVLIRKNHACPDRAEVLTGWTGVMTLPIRDRVLEHAARCPACRPNLPRSVSPARVFAMLPAPVLLPSAQMDVLEFFDDPRLSAYREFVVGRAAELTASVFPGEQEPVTEEIPLSLPQPGDDQDRRRAVVSIERVPRAAVRVQAVPPAIKAPSLPRAVAGVADVPRVGDEHAASPVAGGVADVSRGGRRFRVSRATAVIAGAGAAAVAASVAAAFVLTGLTGNPAASGSGHPAAAAPPPGFSAALGTLGGGVGGAASVKVRRSRGGSSATPPFARTATTRNEALAAAATQPLIPSPAGALSAGGPAAGPDGSAAAAPGSPGALLVTPASLALGSGSAGQLTVTAVGGPVAWSASPSSALVSLSSYQGTLSAGQTVTVTVTVTRNSGAGGSTVVYFGTGGSGPDAATSQAVQVSWASWPGHTSSPPPSPWTPAPRSPSPSQTPSASPSQTVSASPSASSS